MWGLLRRHWRALAGLVPLIPAATKGALALINIGGDIDFIVSRSQDPGWIGKMMDWIINPPGWAILPLIVLGLGLIYWDFRRKLPQVAASIAPQEPADLSRRPSFASSAKAYARSKGRIRHNIHIHGGSLLAGPKNKQFPLLFSVASSNRVHINRCQLAYLGRIRGKQKGERLRVSDFPNSPSFVLETGERFIARNGFGHMIQGLLVEVKDDRYGNEHDEVIFDYSILEDAPEFTAI